MGTQINKHGLKRYIPANIRETIRKEAGFGCVICGCLVVDYEHIEPEWSDAHKHDPENMTLLCIECHGRVTRKLISKKRVWEAKKSPKALKNGCVHDILFVNTDNMEIKIGNSSSRNTRTILIIHGKPIVWFEPPILPNEPSKLCAIFYDDEGKPISYINRNQFVAFTSNEDIKSTSTELSIVASGKKCLLFDRQGDEILHIKNLDGFYIDTSVIIENSGNLSVKQGKSNITISRLNVESCGSAMHFGDIPSINKYNKLTIANRLIRSVHSKKMYFYSGQQAGWEMNGEILNLEYMVVGSSKNGKAYNVISEYIGDIINGYIVYPDNCYETSEPIYISSNNRAFRLINTTGCYDVSFRLFGDGI